MRKRLKVKVCGMRDPANCAEIAALEPDYMGFIFVESSPRFVDSSAIPALNAVIPASIRKIGVFAETPASTIHKYVSDFNLAGLQLHNYSRPETVMEIQSMLPNIEIFYSTSLSERSDLLKLADVKNCIDGFVFDSPCPGSGNKFDWGMLNDYSLQLPFLIAGGVDLQDLETILSLTERLPFLTGIDINSKFETTPGIKDPSKVSDLLKRARI